MGNGGAYSPGYEVLPVQLTRFFGREGEATELVRLIQRERIVTLVGAPGGGKTRLAVEVALRAGPHFAGGVRYAELAPISDPDSVAGAVGDALDISERPGQPMVDVLVDVLGEAEPVLVVLDNCEHVADPTAALVQRLVTACPAVSVLNTSRAALAVPGERIWNIPQLAEAAAVELFVDRARLASGGSDFTPTDRVAIEQICTRLDCLPLAVELTATWTRVLSPRQILDRLTGALPESALAGRGRGSRHDTMAAAVDWSYELLTAEAQRLFRQAAVFAGSFDLDALEAVAGSDDLLRGLRMLVDNSLVLTEQAEGEPMRYRMLEPVRQHAEALLSASGDGDEVRRRHFDHYLDLAGRYDPWGIWVKGQPIRVERLAHEDGNLLAAFEWARRQPSDLGLRLAVAAAMYWAYGGRVNDGLRWVEELLAKGTQDRQLRANAHSGVGLLAWRRGDYDHAHSQLEAAIRVAGMIDDPLFYARTLLRLATVELSAGLLDEAVKDNLEAIRVYHASGGDVGSPDPSVALGIAAALINIGWARYGDGDVTEGDGHMKVALRVNHAFGNAAATAYAHFGLQFGAILGGDAEAQRVHLAAALVAMNAGGIVERADWLWCAVALAVNQGRFHSALRLFGGAEAWGQRRGSQYPRTFGPLIADTIARAFYEVSPGQVDGLLVRGRQMRWDELVAEALSEPQGALPTSPAGESEIAELVADGARVLRELE